MPSSPSSRVSLGALLALSTVVAGVGPASAAPAESPRTLGSLALTPAVQAAPRAVAPVTSKPSMTYRVEKGDTVWAISQRTGVSISEIVRANGLNAAATIFPGQVLTIPSPGSSGSSASTASSSASSSSSSKPSGSTTITIKAGDTLSGLAARHNTTVAAIMSANGMKNTVIYAGRTLTIPGTSSSSSSSSSNSSSSSSKPSGSSSSSSSSSKTVTIKAGDTLSGLAARHNTTVAAIMSANGMKNTVIYAGRTLTIPGTSSSSSSSSSNSSSSSSKPSGSSSSSSSSSKTVTIKAGDTLSGLAARHNTTVAAIMSANGMKNTVIYAGRTLTIPGTSSSSSSSSSNSGVPQRIGNTFLHYTYPQATVDAANVNLDALLRTGVPSRAEMQTLVRETAVSMGVDPALAMAIAMKESSFNHASVSPANAIGTMQVIPSSGEWASDLVGRPLNLLDPQDNVTAGVAIIRQLLRSAPSLDTAIASYYQGLGSVTRNGMFADTKQYVSGVKNLMSQFGG